MNKTLIINASEIVTCSGFRAKKGKEMQDIGVIKDGYILIEGDVIQEVGPMSSLDQSMDNDYLIVDASGKTITPGFIDSHTHFIFGGYREEEYGWRLEGQHYMDIMAKGGGILSSVNGTKEATEEDLITEGKKRLDTMLEMGITTVEGKSGYGLDKDTELKQLRVMKQLNESHVVDIVSTFLGAHAVPKEYKSNSDDYIDFIIKEVLPEVKAKDLADFCDVFCEKGAFNPSQSKELLEEAKSMGMKLKIHADEMTDLGGGKLAGDLGATSADHLLKVSQESIDSLCTNDVVATLLPCTAFSLKEDYAPARKIIDTGCAVALATDYNPGSCHTQSIPLVIALATIYMGMTVEETLTALTINGAGAIDEAHRVGSIDSGKKADLIIHQYPSYKFIPYYIGMSTVEKVMKNGKFVYDKVKSGLE